MNIKRKLITGIASTAILLNALAPLAFADTSLVITGNGADTENTVKVETQNTVSVMQTNDAHIDNKVNANATTGSNDANRNTGGNVKVDTGNATNTVNVGTTVNSNQADVKCNTCGGDVNVTIGGTADKAGNGTGSENKANVETGGTVKVIQNNDAKVDNHVDANAKTGDNEAGRNTGGSVTISTGNAKSDVTLNTMANANSAKVEGSQGGSSITALILGNGADSENSIKLDAEHSITLWQANDAHVDNHVDANAKTGDNEAKSNTGGSVKIETGDATAKVKVDNKVNFNSADADCGCELNVTAKIAGNGEKSENKIKAEDLSSSLEIYQGGEKYGNDARLDNNVDANAKTGDNELKDSTGSVSGDPEISTGASMSDVTLSNTANSNVVGPSADWQMPDLSGLNLDFHFSLGDLLGFLHLG